jgi:hypothetical protein
MDIHEITQEIDEVVGIFADEKIIEEVEITGENTLSLKAKDGTKFQLTITAL